MKLGLAWPWGLDFLERADGGGWAESEPDPKDPNAVERRRMVRYQLGGDRMRPIRHQGVLAAMDHVPRHEFVPANVRSEAYADWPLPIGFGQTISQPYIVALMTELLDPKPTDRILEIGTGSGYQAAVLSRLVARVFTMELNDDLACQAAARFARLGCRSIQLRIGDGHSGWPEQAPFDGIIVTCAPEAVPTPLVDQLSDVGRMVIPVGPPGDQVLYLLSKRYGRLEQQDVIPVRFVPMRRREPPAQ
ncbi:MAG: protein-L-isoaspartate(D-aspartate) O-methyltransferase [Verrucomicrobia bacterium]|nr:protein-L-isoaspartate(D-aspartate) O-methyltransferase [Verrucomicrobiota bacterium]